MPMHRFLQRHGVRSATLRRVTAVAAIAASTVLAPAAAHASSPCQTYCGTVYASPLGTSAALSTWTTVPTTMSTWVYRHSDESLASMPKTNVFSTFHYLTTSDVLEPGTQYDWSAVLTDKSGGKEWRSGTFTTKHRRLQMQISGIKVTDKGNFWGSGDETFYARAGSSGDNPDPFLTDVSLTNGDWVYPWNTVTSIDPPTVAALNVEMVDAHCGFCTYGLGADWDRGSDSQHNWITAWHWVNTSTPTNGWVVFSAVGVGPAGMNVYGYYKVDYA
ncbi:hypothetical protein acdb102_13670 [Acidothermaceae bacterium B102]|nr:hypothetical protein acdb102_13670 [Acidothermaceae bacterium B102]